MTSDIAIIGAGPAGLAAAEILARAGQRVTVFERMASPGRRLLMAGRGGLNLTHSEDFEKLLSRYGEKAPHLAPALRAFPPAALRDWVHGLGVETFVGTSGRVFPRGLKTSPLLRVWLARLDGLGVVMKFQHDWQGWTPEGRLAFATRDGPQSIHADKTLLALGGATWPRLGADGSWVRILTGKNISVVPLKPANVGVTIRWSDYFRETFAGTPLHNIAANGARGEAMVTAKGLEGGAIYAIAGQIRAVLPGSATVAIDLRPDLTQQDIAERIARTRARETISNRLRKAANLHPVSIGLMREASLAVTKTALLPSDAGELAAAIKCVTLPVTGLADMSRAISTAGGLAWNALDADFSLLARPDVFAAGEMLDWEAPTGGYLLQACFATGRWAANGILRRP